MLDEIEAIIDLRRDIKSMLEQLVNVNLAEVVDVMREFNGKMKDIDMKGMLTTMKRLNMLLSKVDFKTLNTLAGALSASDLKEMVRAINTLHELLQKLGESDLLK